MAAERNHVYGGINSRLCNSDLDTSVGEFWYGRVRHGDRGRDKVRIRQKDVKEQAVVAGGGYHYASSRSNSGSRSSGSTGRPRRCGFTKRTVGREPGELSSETGSDGTVDSEPPLLKEVDMNPIPASRGFCIITEHKRLENEHDSTFQSKKRNYSPIVWDRDDKKRSRNSTRNSPVNTTQQSLSHHLQPVYKLANTDQVSIPQIHPIQDGEVQSPEPSPELLYNSSGASKLQVNFVRVPQEAQECNDQIEDNLEDDNVSRRSINASRWANDADSPADESEISDDGAMYKLNNKSVFESAETMGYKSSSSVPLGHLKGEISERGGVRSCLSEEHVRSTCRNSYPVNDLDNNNYIEIDDSHNYSGTSIMESDTESEGELKSNNTPKPVLPPHRTLNMLQGCRSVDEFERLNKIDEGTYGVVYRARDRKTGEIVALKKVKMEKEREGFPLTSLREINILLSFNHASIVDVKEVVVGCNLDSIYMVMEYMEHDLKAFMETMKQPFSQSEVKCLMLQLLQGIRYLHDNWVLHRDLKTSNLLLNNRGELKICDFGMARQYGSPLKPYTHLVVTLWYRAPELLLGAKQYSTAIDMWSLGCIMAELLSKEPLFNGKTEFDQLDKIFKILGTPNETIWPGFSNLPGVQVNFVKHQYNIMRKKFPATSFTGLPVLSDAGFDLLNQLLTYDPQKRITAEAALNHEWFQEVPFPKSKEFMPTLPAQHAQDRRMRRNIKSPDHFGMLQKGGGIFG